MRIRSRLNPFTWPEKTIKVSLIVFFAIALPTYIIIGLQPASAFSFLNTTKLSIPSINLNTSVVSLNAQDNNLETPAYGVGSFSRNQHKTLLIGHSTTIFQNLNIAQIGDEISYNQKQYRITIKETLPKNQISMSKILAPADSDTLIIMTCAGDAITETDYTHRLIVTAKLQEGGR